MVISILIVCLLGIETGRAELIKYRDEEGNLHVVDSPDLIPERYRSKTEKLNKGVTEVATPCDGKEMCAVSYILANAVVDNPSDLLLKMSKSFLKQPPINPKHGIMIMVGQGSVKDNEAGAALIGKGAVPDYQNRIAKEFKSATFPFYFVQNKNKEVVMQGAKAKEWIDQNFKVPE